MAESRLAEALRRTGSSPQPTRRTTSLPSRPSGTSRLGAALAQRGTTAPVRRGSLNYDLSKLQTDQGTSRDRLLRDPNPSLLGQFGNEIKAMVTQGPAMIMKMGAQNAIAPVRAAVDLIKDGELRGDDWYDVYKEYSPLTQAMTTDMNRAYGLTFKPIVQGEGFEGIADEWKQASDEGRTAESIFSVVGNAAVGAGTAARIVGRAGAVGAAASTADAAVIRGLVRGSPRSLSSAATAGRARATMIVPHRQAQNLARSASAGMKAPSVTTISRPMVASRGRGLAGLAQRSGNVELAQRLDTVGRGLSKATRLFDAPDNLTVGWQFAGAGKLAKLAGRQGTRVAQRLAPYFNEHSSAGADNWFNQFVDPDAKVRRGAAQAIMRALQGETTGVRKDASYTLGVIRDKGIDEALGTVVLNSLDQRYDYLASAVERVGQEVGDATVQRMIDERFKGEQPEMRPSVEGIRAIIDFRRNPNSEMAPAILEVFAEIQEAVEARTERALDAGMNPEQLGNRPLTQVLDRERAALEKPRDAALREQNRTYGKQERAQAVDRAREAVNRTIPDPPNPKLLMAQGARAGDARRALQDLRKEHRKAQVELGRTIDDYLQAERSGGPNEGTVRALAAELDRLTEEAVMLEQRITQQQKQLDAGRVDIAEIQVDAIAARIEDIETNRPRLDETDRVTDRSLDGWRRRGMKDTATMRPLRDPATSTEATATGGAPSAANTGRIAYHRARYETERIREGQARVVGDVARRERRTTMNRARRLNDKIANLENELQRDVQTRLIEDINVPAIKGFYNTVRKSGRRFGDVLPAKGDVPAQLTGLMYQVAVKSIGRKGMLAVARRMESLGEFDSVTAKHNAFIDALEAEGVELARDVDGNYLTTPDGSKRLPDSDAYRNMRDSMMAEVALEAMNDAQRAAVGHGFNLSLPYRVRDAARRATAGFPQEFRNKLEDQFARYETRYNKHLRETFDVYLEQMPAAWRKTATALKADVRTFLEMGEQAIARGDLYEAELFHRLAEEAPTNLQSMIDSGYDPTHLVGGDPVPLEEAGKAVSVSGGIGPSTVRGTKQSKVGTRPERIADYVRLEAAEQVRQINSRTMEFLENHPATTRPAYRITMPDGNGNMVSIGELMERHNRQYGTDPTPQQVTKWLDEAGWAPLPRRDAPIGRNTAVVPKMVLKQIDADLLGPRSLPMKVLSWLNQGFKMSVLALSPLWHIGQFVGNLFMTAIMGKVSVLDMPRLARQIVEQSGGLRNLWENEGLATWAPDELAHHGITHGELQLLRDAWDASGNFKSSFIKRQIDRSYRLGSFSDNFFRSMTYADQMQKMHADPFAPGRMSTKDLTAADAAVRHTLRALGDFTSMTPFERRVMREVFPFYAWIRHQTLMTMRMPLYSPMRTAYLIALTDALEDEDFANEFYEMIGSAIPLGGDQFLNLGTLSPFTTPMDLPSPLNVNQLASSLSPVLRVGSQVVTGFDPGALQMTSRPYTDRTINIWGREMAAPPILGGGDGLKEIGYIASGALPQTKLARDAVLGFGVSRYGSGQDRPTNYIEGRNPLEDILGGLRLPRVVDKEQQLNDLTQKLIKQQQGR